MTGVEMCLEHMQKTTWGIKTDNEYHPPIFGEKDLFVDKKMMYFPRAEQLLVIYCESITTQQLENIADFSVTFLWKLYDRPQ